MNASSAKKVVESSQEILWFVARGNILKGPYSTEQLFDCIKRKDIGYLDFCWRQGFREWRPISAVDDLDRRKRLKRVPTYPSVEVPGGGAELPPLRAVPSVPRREERAVRIEFSRGRRGNMSVYEWAFAIIFAVIFAHVSTRFALNRVAEDFGRLWNLKYMGAVETVGNVGEEPQPAVWAPLFSAPSFSDAVETGTVTMEVRKMGSALPVDGQAVVAGYAVTGPLAAWDSWKVEDTELDPVYTRTFDIHGKLSAKDGNRIGIQATGEPWLDNR